MYSLHGVTQDCSYAQSGTDLLTAAGGPDLSAANTVCNTVASTYTTVSNTADAVKRAAGCGVPGVRTTCSCKTGAGLKTCGKDGTWSPCSCPPAKTQAKPTAKATAPKLTPKAIVHAATPKVVTAKTTKPAPKSVPKAQPHPPTSARWPWIVGGAVALTVAVVLLRRKGPRRWR